MSFVAVAVAGAGVVGSVVSANAQKSAAKKAANAQQQSSDAQIALQREQMKYAQDAAAPYRTAGTSADTMLDARWNVSPAMAAANRAYGANPGGAFAPPSPYAAYNGPQSVFSNGAPAQSAQVGGISVPQATAPSRPQAPPAPQPEAPWYQNFQPQGLPPLPTVAQNQPPSPPPPPAPNPNPQAGQGGAYGAYSYGGGGGGMGARGNQFRMVRV